MSKHDEVIYFVQAGSDGPIKIGVTTNVASRVQTLQSSHYEVLHLIGLREGGRFEEEDVHRRLGQHRLGREWYQPVPEVLAEIEEPIAPVHGLLETAIVAKEHLRAAIARLRGSDPEGGASELQAVLSLLVEALAAGETEAVA